MTRRRAKRVEEPARPNGGIARRSLERDEYCRYYRLSQKDRFYLTLGRFQTSILRKDGFG